MVARSSAAGIDLDDVDHAIVRALTADARISMTSLAERVRISRAGAHARVKRLTDAGVISSFTVRVDPVLAGKHASAYVAMSVEQEQWQEVRERLNEIEEIEHIALLGADFDVLALVRARDNRHLRHVVLNQIQAIPSVSKTRTFLIFEDFPTGGLPPLSA